MESPLDAVNRQIQQEKDRHNRVVNDLKTRIDRENTQHQQTMRMHNNRKDQIKRSTKLEHMEECLNKAIEDL